MRPLRLELSGFASFREVQTVAFADADLFALVGATGAGKTSVIDAFCFALYGRVPRLDARVVAPIVSAGQREARVRFDFTVGACAYTAARVVRCGAHGGASTAEARLERGGEVLAGDAAAVTAEVSRLLGLNFEQFTTCVVVPQGEFARFLKQTPKGRQELLVRLLELEVYRRMRAAANERAAAAGARAQAAADQLEALSGATAAAVSAAEARLERLNGLSRRIAAAQPRLEELRAAGKRIVDEGEAAGRRTALLEDVASPADVDTLALDAARLAKEAEAAEAGSELAEQQVAVCEGELAALPQRTALELARRAHEQRAALLADQPRLVEAVDLARAAAERARAAVEEAAAALDALRREHAAHDLARGLAAGAPCPVCAQPLPQRALATAPPAALDEAERLRAAAVRTHEQRALAQAQAEAARAADAARLADLDGAIGAWVEAEAAALLASIDDAERALADARSEARAARQAARAAGGDAREAARCLDAAWRAFDRTRDAVAALDPPAADRRDLVDAWAVLVDWAQARAQVERSTAATAGERAAALREEYRARYGELAEDCAAGGVPLVSGDDLAAAVTAETARTAAALDRLREDLARAARLRAEAAEHRVRAEVARALGQHLRADRFEQWLLDEALQRLVDGASGVLRQLSRGDYSLALDARHQFLVIDHRNADERRPAATLSGGETFLASLALALTLAEHLAELAAGGGARLESLFLDEGFGTLDAAALDVVTAAIEELGARGRTVGVITHVRDLAERMPVRFEVTRTPSTSTIRRLEE